MRASKKMASRENSVRLRLVGPTRARKVGKDWEMKNLAIVLAAVVLGGSLLYQGCSTAVRGPDGEVEAELAHGTLTATMDRGISQVFAAVQAAVHQLGLTTVMAEQDGVSADILARDTQQQTIAIRLGAVSPTRTTLAMRVGIFGDTNKTRVIFRKIQESLRAG
jgi:hypothetical protein